MKKQTIGRQKALKDLQDYYEYSKNSGIRQQWLNQYLVNSSFYRGRQWLDSNILKDMQEIGATPYTYNNIEPLVNTFVSLQIRSSKKVGYDASTDHPEHIRIAENLKQLAYDIQTQNDHSYVASQKFTESLIGGIGWSYFYYKDDKFCYENINPLEVLWDPDDRSSRLNESNFVCRMHYVPAFKLKKQYPDYAKEFENMVEENSTNPSDAINYNTVSESSFWHQFGAFNTVGNPQDYSAWVRGRSIKIVEVFYKKSAKYFQTKVLFSAKEDVDSIPNEVIFETFDKSIAKEKSMDGKIEEKEGTQIWHGIFCDNLLIDNYPIEYQIPNQQYMPLTPVVLKRDFQNIPYGLVDNLISPQKTHNFLWSTTLHYLDAKTIIANDEQVDKEKLREFLKDEMRSKNGVAFIRNPREIQVLDHEKNLNHRMNLIRANYREFETQTGLYDELKGDQTNAISGVAIAQRANNSMNAQNSLVLAYENMIISEGKIMLDTIKGFKNFQYNLKLYKNGKTTQTSLDDSISLLNFEVYPDLSANFTSTIEEEKARFTELLNSSNPALLLSSPLFLREIGFTEKTAYELAEEYMRITGMMQQPNAASQQTEQENEVLQ